MLTYAVFGGESGGAALSSSLDRGREYAEQTRRLAEVRKLACRAVLILTEVLILLMPLTEHFCKWDKLLRDGPDVEFGLLSLLLFAGLVLLTAYRQVTSPFLVLLACWVIALPRRYLAISPHSSLSFPFLQTRCNWDPLLAFSLPATPLRI